MERNRRYRTLPLATLAAILTLPAVLPAQDPPIDLLVSSSMTNSVKRYDGRTGEFDRDLVTASSGGLGNTQEVLLGEDGTLLVSGLDNTAILSYDPRSGKPLGAFTSGYTLSGPTKANWGPDGNLYVSQWGANQSSVAVFDGTTGSFIREATPDLDRPMDQAWDAQGALHVVSFGSQDVRVFDATGTLVDVLVQDSRLQGPVNLWFEGNRWTVVDWQSGTIQQYALDGSHLREFASGLFRPEGWDQGPDGHLYVAEWTRNQVQRLDSETGTLLGAFTLGGGLGEPNGVLFMERLPDFDLSADAATVTVSDASNAVVKVSVQPRRGLAFDAPVTLTCTSPTARLVCSLSRSQVELGQQDAEVTVTFQKVGAAGLLGFGGRALPLLLSAGTVLLLSLVGGSSSGRPRLCKIAFMCLLISGCGGSEPSAPSTPQPETVVPTIEAQGGGLERTVAVAVTIQ